MKTQEMYGEGITGMQVTLSLKNMDQAAWYVAQVEAWTKYLQEKKQWNENFYNLKTQVNPETGEKTERWRTWDEYEKIYPEPKKVNLDPTEFVRLACGFFKQIARPYNDEGSLFGDADTNK